MILQYTVYYLKIGFVYLMQNKCVEILTALVAFLSTAYKDRPAILCGKQSKIGLNVFLGMENIQGNFTKASFL